ncbi:hypothetical protein [Sulfurisphaera ohwakuensis]|uniref:Uncharacterized protein n=1 Tax=Sulfurisphaera ohwakuensis TaxID=69656 RepID=A0A7J9RTC0_SULOH|nr:hypothetical protein [Sulfurisphaera ohwakuensis]MBB5253289.1 hypothetical protein [Sulfurisphaera ohwakuensis]
MNIVEEVLLIIGLLMFPYGIYEIWKGSGDKQTKIIVIGISAILYIVETILALK